MKALVIGLGVSGRGAAKLLLQQGYEVIGVDRSVSAVPGVTVVSEEAAVGPVDVTVVSPGVPRDHPLVVGREAIGEAEFAMRHLRNVAIGITGTNGKTTLTLLMTHLLRVSGKKARALGNVGESLAEYACAPDEEEILVVELSSYQLETMTTRGFDLGLITNIFPDHLDRYPNFEAYKQTKYRLDSLLKRGRIIDADSYLQLTEKKRYWEIKDDPLLRAALALSMKMGISWKQFKEGVATFKRPPHRIEHVRRLRGVDFINDSKGTNAASVLFAVARIKGPILLIAGGRGKGETYDVWKKPFEGKVRKVFAIGEIAPQLKRELDNVEIFANLEDAVKKAYSQAKEQETILLSPGAASFDQFQNYQERGDVFKEIVKNLKDCP
ncbi:MAG: UDP-N-acetylmuramoyl-L-alanine--D-glutamate ligase [Chlamydiia bacterium]|nr:UDP-N-acetylmuramoyl-L-alanine--D-glutamate ligase [Chlamydiia bacterium]